MHILSDEQSKDLQGQGLRQRQEKGKHPISMRKDVHWTITHQLRHFMAKGQQKSNKESKKPKKDTSDAKPIAVDAMRPKPITTTIIPRGKKPVQ